MKKLTGFLFTILLGVSLLLMPQMSQAYNIADVGGIDEFIAKALLNNSGIATEEDWVNSILGGGFNLLDKTDIVEGSGWQKIDGTSYTYAYDVSDDRPEYFLIKTGNNGDKNPYDTFLYKNENGINWAVIDLRGDQGYIKNIGKLSHIDTFGGSSVPEPATMLLLGTGLIGLAVFGKRKFIK